MALRMTPQMRKRRHGAWLLFAFTAAWALAMPSIQLYQAHVMGFGSGLGDGGRMPPAIVEKAGVGNDVRAVVAATSQKASGGGFVEDTARLLFSVAMLAGIILFWYRVMSTLGTM